MASVPRRDNVRGQGEQPVVFLTDVLASYERKRLIEQEVAFIVPGNPFDMPDLGLDGVDICCCHLRTPRTLPILLGISAINAHVNGQIHHSSASC